MNDLAKKIKVYGVIGIIGVCFTIIADIAYNEFQGNELGGALYISFLMLFSFPLWWGGIWVIYQGLKPTGPMWSLIPCLVFAFYMSTVNVFCEGFMACVGSYLACVPMLFLFSIATYLLYKKFKM